jgi:hypothetical protein
MGSAPIGNFSESHLSTPGITAPQPNLGLAFTTSA